MKKSKICISLVFIFVMLCSGVCMASEKVKLTVPTFERLSDEVVEYNGEEQTLELKYFSDDLMTITNNKQKEIGKYDITIALKYPEEYEWEIYDEATDTYSYTTEDQILKWEIVIADLRIPYQRTPEEYNGQAQEPNLRYYNYDDYKFLISISGDCKETEVGTYIAIASLIDKSRSIWEDGTSGDKTIVWKIEEAKLQIPYQEYENEYTGEEQYVDLRYYYDESIMKISGDKATEIGKYTAIISLIDKENYLWEIYDEATNTYTYTSGDQEVEWEITKARVKVPVKYNNNGLEYTGEEQCVNLRYYDENLMKISGDKATEIGKHTAIISLRDKEHYVWKIYDEATYTYTYTSGDQEVEWEIIKAKLYPLRQVTGKYNKYTGEMQKAKFFYFDESLMTISGDEAIAVGKYTATVSLKDKEHYEWRIYNEETQQFEDYTTSEDQKLEWTIEKGTWNVNLKIDELKNQFENDVKAPTYNIIPKATNGTVEVYYSQVAYAQESDGDGLSVGWKGVIYGDKLPWENEELKDSGTVYPWFAWGENGEITGTIDLQFEKDKLPTKAGSYVYAIVVSGDNNLADGCYLNEFRIKTKTTNNNNNNNNNTQSGGGGGSSSSTITYKATITQTKGGTITVDKTEVEKGEKQVFTIVADTGYKIVDVKVDGKSVGAVSTYTIEKVTKKHKITATFEKLTEEELKELEENKETTWVNTFEDVNNNDWYYEAVKFVNEEGLFKGLSETEFGANVTMNRAMIVTVLHRLAGETKASNSNINFNDVSNEEYYTNAVIWAVENGIVNGVGNNEFAPQNNVTREQLIVMLYRYTKLTGKLKENKADLSSYDDSNLINDYTKEAFSWAIEEGIITGRTTTTLAPQGIVTRAEVATMIMRFSNMINEV